MLLLPTLTVGALGQQQHLGQQLTFMLLLDQTALDRIGSLFCSKSSFFKTDPIFAYCMYCMVLPRPHSGAVPTPNLQPIKNLASSA